MIKRHFSKMSLLYKHVQSFNIYIRNGISTPNTEFDLNESKNLIVDVEKIDQKCDHPCFTDPAYVERKKYIQNISNMSLVGKEIPIIDYTEEENKTWNYVTSKILPKISTNCCKEINQNFDLFKNEIGFTTERIPQIRDISSLLSRKTGFKIMPVGGLLSPRVFLNALAFKYFASTQFIRPYEKCEFSGEPDILHEVIGHMAMLCDENFAEFSQDLGIASLGASDENIKILANIYWFTVEYGLVYQKERIGNEEKKSIKVYGGGITPSLFEIDYALKGEAKYHDLDFDKMQTAYYDYVNLSTNYFIAEDFESMKNKFKEYSKGIKAQTPWISFDKAKNKMIPL